MHKLNTINSREVIKRIAVLNSYFRYHIEELDEDDAFELAELQGLRDSAINDGCGESAWENGVELINDKFIAAYAQKKLESDEMLSRHYPSWLVIDWDESIDNFLKDYTELSMGHATFWVRSAEPTDTPIWH